MGEGLTVALGLGVGVGLLFVGFVTVIVCVAELLLDTPRESVTLKLAV